MHKFSTAQNDFSVALTHNQHDSHTGRFVCWSGALIAITLWGGVQFCHQQNLKWQNQHGYAPLVGIAEQTESPALPEAAAVFRRMALHSRQNRLQNR